MAPCSSMNSTPLKAANPVAYRPPARAAAHQGHQAARRLPQEQPFVVPPALALHVAQPPVRDHLVVQAGEQLGHHLDAPGQQRVRVPAMGDPAPVRDGERQRITFDDRDGVEVGRQDAGREQAGHAGPQYDGMTPSPHAECIDTPLCEWNVRRKASGRPPFTRQVIGCPRSLTSAGPAVNSRYGPWGSSGHHAPAGRAAAGGAGPGLCGARGSWRCSARRWPGAPAAGWCSTCTAPAAWASPRCRARFADEARAAGRPVVEVDGHTVAPVRTCSRRPPPARSPAVIRCC